MERGFVTYPPAMKKLGLEPSEFTKYLKDKMAKLFGCEEKQLQGSVQNSIQNATQSCCIRENINNPGQLDQRRSGNQQMHNEGLINPPSSPRSDQEQPRRQGSSNPRNEAHDGYHKKQFDLFVELQKQHKLDSSFGDDGYLKANGDRCTIEGMCNILDGITRSYILEDLPGSATSQSQEAIQNDRKSLREILVLCKSIVIGRIYVDWTVENDIMSDGGYKQWKEHEWALMSFAALLVIIDVLSSSPKYGSNSLLIDEM